MKRVRLHAQRNYLNSEYRYSDFVTEHSLCSMFLAERLKRHLYVSTERQRHLWIRAVLYLEMFQKRLSCGWVILIIFHRLHRDLRLSPTQQTVLSQLLSARKRISMQFSSTRKFFIHRKVQRCFIILYAACAVVLEHGKWTHLLKIRLRKSVKKSATARFYLLFQAVLIHLLRLDFSQEQSENSLHVYS